ncbi:MAG: ABC transporter permease subunit [Planctomycetes bacterium]|nr:ABC transporter permease subunit [Planctomycetota bacterium]
MTLLMCLAVVPFGVLAALYLREYARRGPIVTAVRIAVNNLAGVPSIVYGVFGLGFFCYGFGKYIDGGPQRGLGIEVWSPVTWTTSAIALLVLIAGAVILGTRSSSSRARGATAKTRWFARAASAAWLLSAVLFVLLVLKTPFFGGFYEARLEEGQPTFGTSGLLWASLTLALLTLPVVIVSTEEALAAVPSSMREGSYACGASKWQTIRRIVLPRALPGILTGAILAMARGAGEVAPLMLVGVMKLSQKLAIDSVFPYVHPERSFMHLGFNIYDVGFQSQNAEAGKAIVFTTTLLLVAIIATLNLFAIWLRGRLRRRFVDGAF